MTKNATSRASLRAMPLLPYPYQTLRLSTPLDGATLHARLAEIIQPEPPPGPPFSQGQRPPLLASRAQRLAWARLASGREHKPFWVGSTRTDSRLCASLTAAVCAIASHKGAFARQGRRPVSS